MTHSRKIMTVAPSPSRSSGPSLKKPRLLLPAPLPFEEGSGAVVQKSVAFYSPSGPHSPALTRPCDCSNAVCNACRDVPNRTYSSPDEDSSSHSSATTAHCAVPSMSTIWVDEK